MPSNVSQHHTFRLGSFEIRGKENVLVTPQGDIVLLPKVMALLLYLCRHSQQVVTFDELNTAIWPKEVVGDNAIYNLVGQLRKALGDKATNPIYIQTVSKRGYRLLVEAVVISEQMHAPVRNLPEEEATEDHRVSDSQSLSPQIPALHSVKAPSGKWRKLALVTILLTVFTGLFVSLYVSEPIPDTSQKHLQLARYQLYRGDSKGVTQGIESLQKALATAPNWSIAQTELAHAYLRMARLHPNNQAFWLAKAKAIAANDELNQRAQRINALLQVINTQSDATEIKRIFEDQSVLNSARLNYSRVLFEQGQTHAALEQAQLVLSSCTNCPYVYQQIAAIQMVAGQIQESFDNFSRYRLFLNQHSQSPADVVGYVALNKQTLSEMARWHFQYPTEKPLLAHQRNALALFYLSLGRITEAEELLVDVSNNSTQFFDLYTLAALQGAKGNVENSLELLVRRQQLYPENERFQLSVVYALWQLGQFHEAITAFRQFNILKETFLTSDVLNFAHWSLYAALLQAQGDTDFSADILAKLASQVRTGIVPGSHNADIRLASVLALQGKNEAALEELEIALTQGWVSDFNQNWWYLQDSPYFTDLRNDPKFQQLVSQYHVAINVIYEQSQRER